MLTHRCVSGGSTIFSYLPCFVQRHTLYCCKSHTHVKGINIFR